MQNLRKIKEDNNFDKIEKKNLDEMKHEIMYNLCKNEKMFKFNMYILILNLL